MSGILGFLKTVFLGDWEADVDRLLEMSVADGLAFLTQKANTLSSAQWLAFVATLRIRTTGERGGEAAALDRIADGSRKLTLNEPFRSRGPEQIAQGLRELEYEKEQRKKNASS